jgi:hypothetical protein
LRVVQDQYVVKRAPTPTVTRSREMLPVSPEILIVPGPPG